MSLAFRPRAGASARFEIHQHALLPHVEAVAMHEPADSAGVVVARDADGVPGLVGVDQLGGAQAVSDGDAAPFAGLVSGGVEVADGAHLPAGRHASKRKQNEASTSRAGDVGVNAAHADDALARLPARRKRNFKIAGRVVGGGGARAGRGGGQGRRGAASLSGGRVSLSLAVNPMQRPGAPHPARDASPSPRDAPVHAYQS